MCSFSGRTFVTDFQTPQHNIIRDLGEWRHEVGSWKDIWNGFAYVLAVRKCLLVSNTKGAGQHRSAPDSDRDPKPLPLVEVTCKTRGHVQQE
jgi:hypothetical protein